MRTSRSWLFCAARSSCSPLRTCNDQSRRKSVAKIATASVPRIPILSASLGVGRYGFSTRGSGGRNRREMTRLGNQAYLAGDPLARPEQPSRHRVDGNRQDQVEENGWHDRSEDRARRSALAEHEAQD